jgi:hypothetical protein
MRLVRFKFMVLGSEWTQIVPKFSAAVNGAALQYNELESGSTFEKQP